jgi:hypothetical protein
MFLLLHTVYESVGGAAQRWLVGHNRSHTQHWYENLVLVLFLLAALSAPPLEPALGWVRGWELGLSIWVSALPFQAVPLYFPVWPRLHGDLLVELSTPPSPFLTAVDEMLFPAWLDLRVGVGVRGW